jgi:hypothetical protein
VTVSNGLDRAVYIGLEHLSTGEVSVKR